MHFFYWNAKIIEELGKNSFFYLFKIDDTLNFKDNNVILDLIINGSHSSIVKRSLIKPYSDMLRYSLQCLKVRN